MLNEFSRYKAMRTYYDPDTKVRSYVNKIFNLKDVISYEEFTSSDDDVLRCMVFTADESFILNISFEKFDHDFCNFINSNTTFKINCN